jgi:hypothetical protein
MAWRVLRREPDGPWQGVNHKRIRRLWREEGLRRPFRTHKRRQVTAEQAETPGGSRTTPTDPNSALDGLNPAEYAANWTSTNQPALS